MVDLQSFNKDIVTMLSALETVDVHGSANMTKMLVCIDKLNIFLKLSQEAISQEAMKNENANHV